MRKDIGMTNDNEVQVISFVVKIQYDQNTRQEKVISSHLDDNLLNCSFSMISSIIVRRLLFTLGFLSTGST